MRTFWKEAAAALLMGAVLPAAALRVGTTVYKNTETVETVPIPSETVCMTTDAEQYILVRQSDGTVEETALEQYLIGVVLAEMPAYFEAEALKAQAVVARTYTMKTHTAGGKHGDGSICTDSKCCQAYISVMDYLERGGTGESVDKVRSAVAQTRGQVLYYEGQLIEATYFSCSGGITEDAQAVWGTDYPYLRSVISPGEESSPVYTDTVSFSFADFQICLGATLKGNPSDWFGEVTYTAGNGVDTLQIGGWRYEGKKLRTLLGLRSTNFDIEVTQNAVLFHTKGFGHRVGMSQYGADAMAVNGSSYQEILTHYYQGTELGMIREVSINFLDKYSFCC